MSYASENADALGATARISVAHPRDFYALLKPRVMYLVILTALAGLLVSPGHIHPLLGFVSLLAIAVGAGASGALNMWYDADIDARMTRTSAASTDAVRSLGPDQADAAPAISSRTSGAPLSLMAAIVVPCLLTPWTNRPEQVRRRQAATSRRAPAPIRSRKLSQ